MPAACLGQIKIGTCWAARWRASHRPSPRRSSIPSCCRARTTTASDGPRGGHSPYVRALLDANCGIFAEGVSLHTAIANVSNALPGVQALISIGLEALPQHFCIRPGPEKLNHPGAAAGKGVAAGGGSGVGARRWEPDVELRALLREWRLEVEAGHLAEHGRVTSLTELEEFEELDTGQLQLPVLQTGASVGCCSMSMCRRKRRGHFDATLMLSRPREMYTPLSRVCAHTMMRACRNRCVRRCATLSKTSQTRRRLHINSVLLAVVAHMAAVGVQQQG